MSKLLGLLDEYEYEFDQDAIDTITNADKRIEELEKWKDESRAGVFVAKAKGKIAERDRRIEELNKALTNSVHADAFLLDRINRLEAHIDIATGFGKDWEKRAKAAESQLERMRGLPTYKGDLTLEDSRQIGGTVWIPQKQVLKALGNGKEQDHE